MLYSNGTNAANQLLGGLTIPGSGSANYVDGAWQVYSATGYLLTQGFQGLQGSTGPQGYQGLVGNTGPQGYQGLQGNTGTQGYQGLQGSTGAQGTPGTPGSPGSQGSQGFQGATGAQGATDQTLQTVLAAGGTTVLTAASPYNTIIYGTLPQVVALPNATTLYVGKRYEIDNDSNGTNPIVNNLGATVWVNGTGTGGGSVGTGMGPQVILACTGTTTAAGSWEVDYSGVNLPTNTAQNYPVNKVGAPLNDGYGNMTWGYPLGPATQLDLWGHSWFDDIYYLTGPDQITNFATMPSQQLPLALNLQPNLVRNHARSGANLCSQGRQMGGFVRFLTEINRYKKAWPFARYGGLSVIIYGINDLGNFTVAQQPLMQATFQNCLTMAISRIRASAIYPAGAGLAQWAFNTGWSAGSANADWSSVNGMVATTTNLANATFTIPLGYKGEPICFLLVGTSGATAGTVTWGGTVAGTTGIVGLTTNLNSTTLDAHGPIPIRFTAAANGLSPLNAGQNITITVTAISGTVQIDSAWIESAKPDPVIVCNVPHCDCRYMPMVLGDGTTTGANLSFWSPSANFSTANPKDTGASIIELDAQGALPPGETVAIVNTAGSVTMSANALKAATGIQFSLGRIQNGYANYATNTDFSGAIPSNHAAADADVTALNQTMVSTVALFDSMVQYVDLDPAFGYGGSALPPGVYSYTAYDGFHPNELGSSRIVQAVVQGIQKLAPPATDYVPLGQVELQTPLALLPYNKRNIISSGQYYTVEGCGTGSNYVSVAGDTFATPFMVTEANEEWQNFIVEQMNAPTTSGANVRLGFYDDVMYNGYPQNLRTEMTAGGAFALGTTAGVKTVANLTNWLRPGLYWIVLKVDSLGTTPSQLRTIVGPNPYMPGWASGGGVASYIGWKLTGVGAGALPTSFPTGAAITNVAPMVGIQVTLA